MNRLQLADGIEIVEVCLRDGLQNEAKQVPTEAKLELVGALIAAGASRIEAVSFVHPRLVPSMADAEQVMAGVPRPAGVSYAALVLNERGLQRAEDAGVDEVNFVVCASDTFNRRNQNASREGSLHGTLSLIERARTAGLFVTFTVATAFGCPFEGEVDAGVAVDMAAAALAAGAHEICFADTIGAGVPTQVHELGTRLRDRDAAARLRFHFHNTRNTGYANAGAALAVGAEALDSSSGGIGGCPFAPNATGNIATEDLMYMLDRMGIGHPGTLSGMVPVAGRIEQLLGRLTESLVVRAGEFPSQTVVA